MRRHIVLVGLPGSGKSVVGGLVAARLETSLVDVDLVIEQHAGMSVARIFSERGESWFREQERAEVAGALTCDACVIAPGGGWAAHGDNLAEALDVALVVYLRTDPREAAGRLGTDHGRPLLTQRDPVRSMTELLGRRSEFYERTRHVVVTDGRRVETIAEEVVALARSRAGW